MNRVFVALAGLVLGCGVWCEQTQADPIVGSIEFFGSAVPSGSSPGSPITLHFNDPWHTLAGTGIYASAGVPFGTPATFNDFDFTGDGTLAALVAPAAPLWSFSFGGVDYSFDLLTLTNAHTDPGSMSFTGTGVAHATGFEDTFGSIAVQGSGSNFSFQISTSTTSSVPESGVTELLLLGFGLATGYTCVRKRMTA
jgi:hypothetical protein